LPFFFPRFFAFMFLRFFVSSLLASLLPRFSNINQTPNKARNNRNKPTLKLGEVVSEKAIA